jgi:hypothetical protein
LGLPGVTVKNENQSGCCNADQRKKAITGIIPCAETAGFVTDLRAIAGPDYQQFIADLFDRAAR